MSSPSGRTSRTSRTRSQDSVHSSSQYAAGTALEDTASSVRHTGQLPGSSATLSPRAPNSAFERRRAMTRARSASPGLRRSLSPLGISVAQRRAQLTEQVAESAMSGVGRVADETRRAREVAEAAIAEAKSVHGEVQSKVASLTARADASAAHAVEVLSGRVQEVAEQSQVQTSRVAVAVAQQLEKEIEAAASSTAATAEIHTRTAVEGMRRDVQAQIEQTRADAQRRDEETQKTIQQIAAGLEQLTKQLNDFRPVNVEHVGVAQKQVSENIEQRLNLQSNRIDDVTESVQKAQRAAEENAELLQNLLVGVENMGENLKNFREEFQNAERVYEDVNEELLAEVPLSAPAVSGPSQISFTTVPTSQFPVPINPTVSIPASSEIISDPGLQSMQERLSAIRQPGSGPFIPPASRAPQGFNFGQDGQTSVPPIFKMGSVKTSPPEKHVHFQTGIKVDTNANFEPKDKTEWYWSKLAGRWVKTTELLEEAKVLASEASQPTATSSTTISEAHAAEVKAQVQQAINEGFAKARTNVAEVSKSGMTNPSPSVIDLVTPSPSPQQVEESGVLPASPISVASTPSQSGNGGSAPGLSRLTHATTAASPPQIFATMHWKPKEPPCFFGRSTEDVHMDILGASLPILHGR